MKNLIPHYYNSKRNTVLLVLVTALFAELFILIFMPFQSRQWVDSDWQYLLWATLVVLVAMGVIALSRTLMYHYAKRHEINYISYAFWILGEVSSMALIYTLFPLVILPEMSAKLDLTFFPLFREAVLDTAFILLIPYCALILWFELEDKNRRIRILTGQLEQAGEMQPDRLNLYDEKGELKLSVQPEMLYYIESADNYVLVHYEVAGKMQNMMLRTTLKRLTDQHRESDMLRCHRSYIVNFTKVRLLRRNGNELLIDFGDERLPAIPVSQTYAADVMERFTRTLARE